MGALGSINTPLNFLASIALYTSGTVLLLQYIFGHRNTNDACPHCPSPWHPYDDQDPIHLPYSTRTGEWWRRSFMNARTSATAIEAPQEISPVAPDTPDISKFSSADTEVSSMKVRRFSYRSAQRPSVRQVELPDTVYLPRLTLQPDPSSPANISSTDSSASDANPHVPKSPFQNLLRKSRQSLTSWQQSRNTQISPIPPVPQIGYPIQTVQIDSSRNEFRSDDLTDSRDFSSYPPPQRSKTFVPSSSSLNSSSGASTVRSKSSRTPLIRPPIQEGNMLPSRPAPIPKQFGTNVSRASSDSRQATHYYL